MSYADRRFLMLQGPHGPFFSELGRHLRAQGAQVWKLGVNAGDEAEWRGPGYVPLRGPADFDTWIAGFIRQQKITDLVLYGEARPLHSGALKQAHALGVRPHILEEGYLRPHWITYERQGSNGRSPAARWSIDEMRDAPAGCEPLPAARWGALRHHVAYGALYHLRLLLGARRYPDHTPHRDVAVHTEALRALTGAVGLPWAMLWRTLMQRRVLAARTAFYVLLLQLEHDSALAASADLARHETVLTRTMAAFARHAPAQAHLVVKMHPLESRRLHVSRLIARVAARHDLTGRVHGIPGGRLAPLLDRAAATITVTSTAGQQVLWRTRPLFAMGRTIYSHPALVPQTTLARFMADPLPPDPVAYDRFRAFLFRTSQIPGSFYAPRGRAQAIATLLERFADDTDPYDREAAPEGVSDADTLNRRAASGQLRFETFG